MSEEKTIPTYGYSRKGPKLFELKEGEGLPKGYFDHPDKVKGGSEPAEAEEKPADAN